jgi:hypothetical protein
LILTTSTSTMYLLAAAAVFFKFFLSKWKMGVPGLVRGSSLLVRLVGRGLLGRRFRWIDVRRRVVFERLF